MISVLVVFHGKFLGVPNWHGSVLKHFHELRGSVRMKSGDLWCLDLFASLAIGCKCWL